MEAASASLDISTKSLAYTEGNASVMNAWSLRGWFAPETECKCSAYDCLYFVAY